MDKNVKVAKVSKVAKEKIKKEKKPIDPKKCHNCNAVNQPIHLSHQVRLCKECRELDQYKLITKKTIKENWFLTEKDLEEIEMFEVNNPYYKCAAPMCLYVVEDIKNTFCEKYNAKNDQHSIEKKKEHIIEQKEIKKNAPPKINKAKEKRERDLITALREKGLDLRGDSDLCKKYISGKIKKEDWPLERIIERMCEMKYLFEYCDMDSAFEEAKEQYRELGMRYDPQELFEDAERIALCDEDGNYEGYPEVFPWLE